MFLLAVVACSLAVAPLPTAAAAKRYPFCFSASGDKAGKCAGIGVEYKHESVCKGSYCCNAENTKDSACEACDFDGTCKKCKALYPKPSKANGYRCVPPSKVTQFFAGVKDGFDGVCTLVGEPLGRMKAGLYKLDSKFLGGGIKEFAAVASTYFSKDFEKAYRATHREKEPGVVLIFVLAFVAWAAIGYGLGQMTQPDHRPPAPVVKLTTKNAAPASTAAPVFSDDEGTKDEDAPKVVQRKVARGRTAKPASKKTSAKRAGTKSKSPSRTRAASKSPSRKSTRTMGAKPRRAAAE